VLIVQIPSVGDLFDGPNTVSLASTGNIVMTGADATQARLAAAGLDDHGLAAEGIEGAMRPVYMAEQGILEAQYATYLSRLLQVSLGALCLAFLVAAGVNAMVAGILHARRDFPLRLGGATGESVVRPRALRDVLVGATAALVVLLVALRNPETLAATALAALAGLAAVYASHIVAASAVFTRVTHRKL
jgi:hypothetical protein